MFISDNSASFHLWWKENFVKYREVSKYYETDCRSQRYNSEDKKNKSEIKKELELMPNGGSTEMKGVQEKSEDCTTNKEDAAKSFKNLKKLSKRVILYD